MKANFEENLNSCVSISFPLFFHQANFLLINWQLWDVLQCPEIELEVNYLKEVILPRIHVETGEPNQHDFSFSLHTSLVHMMLLLTPCICCLGHSCQNQKIIYDLVDCVKVSDPPTLESAG